MQRQIKFRAWFPAEFYSEPHMAYWTDQDYFGGRSATWDLKEIMQSGKPDHPIYMQYTGLKDKNGAEIYEGDIVTFKTFYFGNERDNKKVVEWRQWVSDDFGQPDNAGYFNIGSHMEVIGNIYENGELLERIESDE